MSEGKAEDGTIRERTRNLLMESETGEGKRKMEAAMEENQQQPTRKAYSCTDQKNLGNLVHI